MIGSSTCIMQEGILGPIKRESRVRQRGSDVWRQEGKRKAQKGDFLEIRAHFYLGNCNGS